MIDVLDELRAANPVDVNSLEIPAGVAARVLRPAPTGRDRRRRLHRPLVVLGAAAAVLLVILLLPGGRDGTPNLAARAYAATTGEGIIHWRTEQYGYSNGRQVEHQRSQGWAGEGVTHVVRYEVRRGNARLVDDTRTVGGRSKIYIAAADDYLSTSAPTGNSGNPLGSGDPFAIFRSAYRSGKLRRVGSQRYAVSLLANDPNGREAIYDLDPRTALPKRFTLTGSTTNGGKRYDNQSRAAVRDLRAAARQPSQPGRAEPAATPGRRPEGRPSRPPFRGAPRRSAPRPRRDARHLARRQAREASRAGRERRPRDRPGELISSPAAATSASPSATPTGSAPAAERSRKP